MKVGRLKREQKRPSIGRMKCEEFRLTGANGRKSKLMEKLCGQC